jgi:hypothetical protein
MEKLAATLYPNLVDETTKREMRQIVRDTEPSKLAAFDARMQNKAPAKPASPTYAKAANYPWWK